MHEFDDTQHLHVGYYEDGKDIEGIFFKVAGEDTWCLFFEPSFYQIHLHGSYEWNSSFGALVLTLETEELTYERGCEFFKQFLQREGLC